MTPNDLVLTATVAGKPMTVRTVKPSDQAAVLQLHSDVFSSGVQPNWHAWKYSPGQGGGHAVGVWNDHRLIAHCGGLPRRLLSGTDTVSGLQIGDVMVAPDWRGLMTRSSPFFHASKVLYSHWIGAHADHAVGYGFPNHRHLRLAVKQGLLWDAGAIFSLQWELVCPVTPPPQHPTGWYPAWYRRLQQRLRPFRQQAKTVRSDEIAIQALRDTPELLARSWHAMHSEADVAQVVMGVRDEGYLHWRYLHHPTQTYRCLRLMDGGDHGDRGHDEHSQDPKNPNHLSGLLGLVFWRLDGDTAMWLDWVGPMRWLPEALRHCQAAAASAGARRLTAWMSPVAASMLGETMPSVQPTHTSAIPAVPSQVLPGSMLTISEVARVGVPQTSCWPQGGEAGVTSAQWWWMGGDTDFL